VNTEDALRFLALEASECRERDAHEALCLLLPGLLRVLSLQPMNHYEASAFRKQFKEQLTKKIAPCFLTRR
jgi:hypothetical protein